MEYYNQQEILEEKIKLLYRIMMIYNYDDILDAIIIVDKELGIQLFIEEELYPLYNEEFIEFKELYYSSEIIDYDYNKEVISHHPSNIQYYYDLNEFFITNIFFFHQNEYDDFVHYDEHDEKTETYLKIEKISNFLNNINDELILFDKQKEVKSNGQSNFIFEIYIKDDKREMFGKRILSNDLYQTLKECYKNITIEDIDTFDNSFYYSEYYYQFLYRYNDELKTIEERKKIDNNLLYTKFDNYQPKRKNKI